MGLFGFGSEKKKVQNQWNKEQDLVAQYGGYDVSENDIVDSYGYRYAVYTTENGKTCIACKMPNSQTKNQIYYRYNRVELTLDDVNTELNQHSSTQNVYNARVVYYEYGDTQMNDERDTRHNFKNITIGIDQNAVNDPNYLNVLMTQLLDRKRVMDCLEDTYSYDASRHYGDYVGFVGYSQNRGGYTKMCDVNVAQYRHNQYEENRAKNEVIKQKQQAIDIEKQEYYNKIKELDRKRSMIGRKDELQNDSHEER